MTTQIFDVSPVMVYGFNIDESEKNTPNYKIATDGKGQLICTSIIIYFTQLNDILKAIETCENDCIQLIEKMNVYAYSKNKKAQWIMALYNENEKNYCNTNTIL
jgi:hypothetical protein